MKWLIIAAASLMIPAAAAGPLPDVDIDAGQANCHAWIEPFARFGPQVKATCTTPAGECAVRIGPGPMDAPALTYSCS